MKRNLLISAGILIVVIALYFANQPSVEPIDKPNDTTSGNSSKTSAASHESTPTVEEGPYDRPDPNDPRLTRQANGTVHYNPAIQTSRTLSSSLNPKHALEALQELIEHYRYAYKENPVGVENFEFTEQLLGKNPMRIIFIDPQSNAIKGNELVDAWDTPYFFHPLSATEMELRSAGPDRQLWTSDDIHSSDSTP